MPDLQLLDKAIAYLERARTLAPARPDIRELLADIYLEQQRVEPAVQSLIEMSDLLVSRDSTAARNALRRAIDLHTDYPPAYEKLAILALQSGATTEWSELMHQLAGVFARQNRKTEAARVYQAILKRTPKDVEARRCLIDIQKGLGSEDESLSERISLARSLEEKGDRAEALKEYIRALDIAPQNRICLERAAELALEMGQRREAYDFFVRLGDLASTSFPDEAQPTDPHARKQIAKEKAQLQNEARRWYERAHDLMPQEAAPLERELDLLRRIQPEGELLVELKSLTRSLGDIYRALDRFSDAERLFNDLALQIPQDPEIRRQMAELYEQSGRRADALESLLSLSRIHTSKGESGAAVELLQSALELCRDVKSTSDSATGEAHQTAARELEIARLLGQSLADQGDPSGGAELLLRYADKIRQDPDWFSRQNCERSAKDEIIQLCQCAAGMEPGHIKAQEALARAYAEADQMPLSARVHAELARLYLNRSAAEPALRDEALHQAIAALEKACEQDPGEFSYLERLQKIQQDREDADGALQSAISLATRMHGKGRTEEALKVLKQCSAEEARNPESLLELARALQSMNAVAEAAEAFRQAGDRHLQQNNPAAAFVEYESALKILLALESADAPTRDQRIRVAESLLQAAEESKDTQRARSALRHLEPLYRVAGRTEKAAQVLRRMIEIDPEDRESRELLCRAWESAGEQAQAGAAYVEFGEWLSARGQLQDALHAWRQARDLGEGGAELQNRIARTCLSAGLANEAAEEFLALARLHADTNQVDLCRAACEEAAKLTDGNIALCADIVDLFIHLGDTSRAASEWYRMAARYTENQLVDRAVECLRKASEVDPAFLPARRQLADVYAAEGMLRPAIEEYMTLYAEVMNCGDADAGREILRKVLALDENHVHARQALAEQLFIHGEKVPAAQELLKMAQILADNSHYDEALLALQEAREVAPKNSRVEKASKALRDDILKHKQSDSSVDDIADARRLLDNNQIDEAIAAYESVLTRESDDGDALMGLGKALWKKGETEKALQHFLRAIQLTRERGTLRNAMKICWDVLDLDRKAEPILEILGELEEQGGSIEKAVDSYLNLGEIRSEKGDVDGAISILRHVIDLVDKNSSSEDPKTRIPYGLVTAKGSLARLLAQKDKRDEAASLLVSLGDLFKEHGGDREACEAYRRAVKIDPENLDARERFAQMLLETGQEGEAARELAAVAQLHGSNGRPELAIPILQQVLHVKPAEVEARLALAEMHAQTGNAQAAAQEYRQAGNSWSKSGNRDAAIRAYQRVVELNPVDNASRRVLAEELKKAGRQDESIQEYLALGNAYIEQKMPGKAVEILQKTAELFPENRTIRESIIDLYCRQGATDRATRELMLLGDACHREKDPGTASRYYNKIVDLDPKNTRALSKLAVCLFELGEHTRAGSVYGQIADIYSERGILGKATEVLSTALERFPADIDLREKLAVLYEKRGMAEVAKREYKRIQELNPGDPRAAARIRSLEGPAKEPENSGQAPGLMARATAQLKNAGTYLFGRGAGSFGNLMNDNSQTNEPSQVSKSNRAEGLEYYGRKRYARAIPCLEAAVAEFERGENSENPLDMVNALATCYIEMDRPADAVKTLKKILTLSGYTPKDQIETQYLLGLAYEKQNKAKEALAAWKAVYSVDANYKDISTKILWSKRESQKS